MAEPVEIFSDRKSPLTKFSGLFPINCSLPVRAEIFCYSSVWGEVVILFAVALNDPQARV